MKAIHRKTARESGFLNAGSFIAGSESGASGTDAASAAVDLQASLLPVRAETACGFGEAWWLRQQTPGEVHVTTRPKDGEPKWAQEV